MELQIQNLVSSIRKEGIEAANKEAESIIAEAKKKAESIVSGAKAEAQQYKDGAEKEISILRESAAVSAEQAKRDAVLAFKTEIQSEFEKILAADIGKELKGEGLGKLIRAAVAGENVSNYAAEVSEVNDALKAELAQEIKDGLEIRPTKGVQQGFRLAAKDGSGYFDCSDDAIMEMLMPYFRNLDFQ
jgi:V/A-type H+-transporting ATPase subunit E